MATPTIVPAVLTDNLDVLKASLMKFKAFAKRVQVDIADGTMTATKTVAESAVVVPAGLAVDVHMMVKNPAEHMDALLKMKPSLVIFQAEVEGDLLPVFATLKNVGINVGVAFLKQTYPGKYKQYVDVVDHVLIFASELGVQGAEADMLQIEKARIIRAMRKDVEIGWDGGATLSNVRTIFQGGVSVINVGSAIMTATDPEVEYKALLAEAEKLGVM